MQRPPTEVSHGICLEFVEAPGLAKHQKRESLTHCLLRAPGFIGKGRKTK